jgi:hypothetical protein
MPEPQRLLPSLNVEHVRPDLQSPSLEHESHSSPVVLQLLAGRASSTSANNSHRVRFIEAAPVRLREL